MTTPVNNLRAQLREAGCQIEIAEQLKGSNGARFELWLIYRPEAPPVRATVIDEGADGYALFVENLTLKLDDDVAAILGAGA